MRKIIASVDIGSHSIKVVVGEIHKNKLNVLAVNEEPSQGIGRGFVVNSQKVKDSLKVCLDQIEETLGLKVRKVIVNIPARDVIFDMTKGKTTITNTEHIISGDDIARALQGCVYNKINPKYELVSIMPIYFLVDEEKKVADPKGIIANKLEATSIIASALKTNVYPILTCLEELGLEVIDITFNNIGDFYATSSEVLATSNGAIVNVGHEVTDVAIFNKGVMANCTSINVGGKNIENDIKYIYKVQDKDAKKLKEKLALAHVQMASSSEKIKVKTLENEEIEINQYELSEIVMSRVIEILNLVKKELNYLTKKQISYIMFTGGVTEMSDFKIALESVFGKNASVMNLRELGVRNNKYSSCVGMIKYFNNKMIFRNKEFSIFSIDEQEELGSHDKVVNVPETSVLGKLFGYFFDN